MNKHHQYARQCGHIGDMGGWVSSLFWWHFPVPPQTVEPWHRQQQLCPDVRRMILQRLAYISPADCAAVRLTCKSLAKDAVVLNAYTQYAEIADGMALFMRMYDSIKQYSQTNPLVQLEVRGYYDDVRRFKLAGSCDIRQVTFHGHVSKCCAHVIFPGFSNQRIIVLAGLADPKVTKNRSANDILLHNMWGHGHGRNAAIGPYISLNADPLDETEAQKIDNLPTK